MQTVEALRARTVVSPDGCWLWTGKRKNTGYGQAALAGVQMNAHRAMFILTNGPVPGLEVDHLCGNRGCVNPSHLEAVTHLVNVRRQARVRSDFCGNGHLRDEHAYMDSSGHRRCRICVRTWEQKRWGKR